MCTGSINLPGAGAGASLTLIGSAFHQRGGSVRDIEATIAEAGLAIAGIATAVGDQRGVTLK